MRNQRVQMIVVTAVVFIAAASLTAVFANQIIRESALLQTQIATIQKDREQENQLTRMKKLALETASDRELLNSYYLANQSDSIDFLNYVEGLAIEQGISLETVDATEKNSTNGVVLSVSYSLEGTLDQVENFISILENIPYVSEIIQVELVQATAIEWSGDILLEVIMLENHEASN